MAEKTESDEIAMVPSSGVSRMAGRDGNPLLEPSRLNGNRSRGIPFDEFTDRLIQIAC